MPAAELVTMSAQELDRLTVIERVLEKRLTQVEAGKQLGITPRQVRRLLGRYRRDGAAGLVSKKRGKRSNNAYPDALKSAVIERVRQDYPDFGPTLIAEKLGQKHDIELSRETVRQWLREAGIWKDRRQRRKRVHQPRYRRDCLGELIQIDGSQHRWFEGRGPKCTLLVYIDDATGRLMELRFTDSETTFDYFHSTRRYLERHGKPVAFYSDRHTVFRVNNVGATGGNGLTQFGRALHELNIDIIYANSSQAKGRVERVNKTLQDRLVKELRLEGIDTIETANTFLPTFIEPFNAKFAKEPVNPTDLHRPLSALDDLDEILSWQEDRTVSRSLTVQYDRVVYLLEPTGLAKDLQRKKVRVYDYPDGTIALKYQGAELPYSVFDKLRQVKQADIVSNKRLGSVLQMVREQQQVRSLQRSKAAPKRRGQQRICKATYRMVNPAALSTTEQSTT
jgi:transposase